MFFRNKKSKSANSEKRLTPRTGFYQASYFLPSDTEDNSATYECWFNNISDGGMAIETREDLLKEGDEIRILYKLGVKVRNDRLKVVSSRKSYNNFQYGCAFVETDSRRSTMITEYAEYFDNKSGK